MNGVINGITLLSVFQQQNNSTLNQEPLAADLATFTRELWPPGEENLPAPYMAKRWQLRPFKKSAHMAHCPTSLHCPLFMEALRNETEMAGTRFQFKSQIVNRTSPYATFFIHNQNMSSN